MTRKQTRREQLHDVYMYVVNNWAVSTADVVGSHGDPKTTRSLLKALERKNLIVAEHVNGEKEVTWQSHYDVENENKHNGETLANADFNAAFPGETVAKKGGSTGPRYTDAQIKAGLKAKKLGQSNKQVAEAAGVKSPSYFAKVLKAEIKRNPGTYRKLRTAKK